MAVTSIANKLKSGSLLVGNSYYIPPSFESIATVTVGAGGSSSISFSSIPSTYKHLQIRGISRVVAAGGAPAIVMQFNSDTGSNYKSHYLEGSGASASSGAPGTVTYGYVGYPTPGTVNTSMYSATIIDILDYANTNKYKTSRSLTGYDTNNTVDGYVDLFSNLWMNTNAITSISLTLQGVNFAQYSQFALYGVKG